MFCLCVCVCVLDVLSTLPRPPLTHRKEMLGGKRQEGVYLVIGEGLQQHYLLPSFPDPGNSFLASVFDVFLLHVTGRDKCVSVWLPRFLSVSQHFSLIYHWVFFNVLIYLPLRLENTSNKPQQQLFNFYGHCVLLTDFDYHPYNCVKEVYTSLENILSSDRLLLQLTLLCLY